MNAKLKIICTGEATFVELDGKTIGSGIEAVKLTHDAGSGDDPRLDIRINLEDFHFMPDGYIKDVEERLEKANPPDDPLNGRRGVTS